MDELNESTPRAGATGGEEHELSSDANRSPGSPSGAADLTENELEDVVGGMQNMTGVSTISDSGTSMKRAPLGPTPVGGAGSH